MNDPVPSPMPDTPGVRALKFAVIGMGVLIVLGVLTVIGRIVYLANQGPRQASSVASAVSGARLAAMSKLSLPAQSHVRQVSLSGDRLAVHYEGATGSAIAIVDLVTGNVISRIEVVPEVPR